MSSPKCPLFGGCTVKHLKRNLSLLSLFVWSSKTTCLRVPERNESCQYSNDDLPLWECDYHNIVLVKIMVCLHSWYIYQDTHTCTILLLYTAYTGE